MRTVLLINILFVFLLNATSQTYIKPRIEGTFDQNSCNNTVICEAYGLPPLAWIVFEDQNINWQEQYVFDGDTILNYCIADYASLNTPKLSVFSSNGYLHSYQIYSSPLPQHLNYNVISYTEPTSDSTNDGFMTIQFDSASVLQSYEFQLGDQNWVVPDTTHTDAFTLQFDSLSVGYYFIGIQDPINASDYTEFRIYIGDMNDVYVNTGLDVELAVQHDSSNCDGWILALPTNGVGTPLNVWNDGTYNHQLSSNLCPGMYSVYSYDANVPNYIASIDTIVIANDGTSYIDSNLYINPIQDTTYFNAVNCNFDYSAPIDSVTYFEDTVFNNGSLVILTFEMTMYQDTSLVTVSDSLVLINDSLIMVDVVIYCGGLPRPITWEGMPNSADKFGYEARRIALLRGVDSHNFIQGAAVGIEEPKLPELNIYPNPAHSNLIVDYPLYQNAVFQIMDLNGKIILPPLRPSSNSTSIDLSRLNQGIYILQVNSEEGIQYKRFIKE